MKIPEKFMNKWSQCLIDIDYPGEKTNFEILLKPCEERKEFLIWIANTLSKSQNPAITSTPTIKNVLCKYVYIPKNILNSFVELKSINKNELEVHLNVWNAIFEILTRLKSPLPDQDLSMGNILKLIKEVEMQTSDQEDQEGSNATTDVVTIPAEHSELLNDIKNLTIEIDKTLSSRNIIAEELKDLKLQDFFDNLFEILDKYEKEVIPCKNVIESNDLATALPSLCTSYSTLKKFYDDGTCLFTYLKKLNGLKCNRSERVRNPAISATLLKLANFRLAK